jgi:hypothetical protein
LYTWVVLEPLPITPSPKIHEYDTMVPRAAEEPTEVKLTEKGAVPVLGDACITAVGGFGGDVVVVVPPPPPEAGVVHAPTTRITAPNRQTIAKRPRFM